MKNLLLHWYMILLPLRMNIDVFETLKSPHLTLIIICPRFVEAHLPSFKNFIVMTNMFYCQF